MNPSQPPSEIEIRIRPNTSWFHIDLEGLKNYRDLLWLLVQRDFTSKYKQTILGPLWFLVSPIINSLAFTLVFGKIVGVSTDKLPPMIFFLSGQLAWTYFSTVLGSTANSLAGNTHLFAKVYFPRLIPPLAVTISSLLALVIQLVTFLGFYAHHQLTHSPDQLLALPSINWLLFPLIVVHMAVLALGVGLTLSALSAKYRDIQQVQGFFVTLWMYGSPVIYPLSTISEKFPGFVWLAHLNPMTAIVETTRFLFLGVGTVTLSGYATSVAITLAVFALGLFSYQKSARTFVDTV
ncbi:ABC transporter permease [Nibricoccus aquaticus]|uniref:Transport permease protein n=1 Tax=Nibricoccus aquaticus TaxID=2576891 RepID=A0A290Q3N3_9BACT|nr:ABC transporter permease [Nibricoccus aquaticus]ATC63279.1 ABC transporter permease [Nibricoccus aquaticus]